MVATQNPSVREETDETDLWQMFLSIIFTFLLALALVNAQLTAHIKGVLEGPGGEHIVRYLAAEQEKQFLELRAAWLSRRENHPELEFYRTINTIHAHGPAQSAKRDGPLVKLDPGFYKRVVAAPLAVPEKAKSALDRAPAESVLRRLFLAPDAVRGVSAEFLKGQVIAAYELKPLYTSSDPKEPVDLSLDDLEDAIAGLGAEKSPNEDRMFDPKSIHPVVLWRLSREIHNDLVVLRGRLVEVQEHLFYQLAEDKPIPSSSGALPGWKGRAVLEQLQKELSLLPDVMTDLQGQLAGAAPATSAAK